LNFHQCFFEFVSLGVWVNEGNQGIDVCSLSVCCLPFFSPWGSSGCLVLSSLGCMNLIIYQTPFEKSNFKVHPVVLPHQELLLHQRILLLLQIQFQGLPKVLLL